MYQFLKSLFTIFFLTNCAAFCYSQFSFSLDDTSIIYKDVNGKIMTRDSLMSFVSKGSFSIKKNEISNGKTEIILFRKTQEENEKETKLETEKMRKWINHSFPAFEIKNISGASVKNKDLQGKITVVNFWFTACQPCIREMPDLNKLVKQYQDSVNFIAFTFNEIQAVKTFLQKYHFDYMQLPGAEQLIKTLEISNYPTHMVLDKNGKIKEIEIGATDNIADKIAKLIEQSLK